MHPQWVIKPGRFAVYLNLMAGIACVDRKLVQAIGTGLHNDRVRLEIAYSQRRAFRR